MYTYIIYIYQIYWNIFILYIYLFICFFLNIYIYIYHRRKFRSQTSDKINRWKAEMGRVREKRRVEERRSEKRKSQKKEDVDARVGRKVPKHCVFSNDLWLRPEARIVGSLQRRVRSQLARWEMNNCTPSWPEAHVQVKKCKTDTRFGALFEVEMSKKCTPLWREAHFKSQNVQNTSASEHF